MMTRDGDTIPWVFIDTLCEFTIITIVQLKEEDEKIRLYFTGNRTKYKKIN